MYPLPERNVKNAINILRSNSYLPRPTNFGAYKMSGEKITLLSRTIVQIMTGDVSQDDFIKEHQYTVDVIKSQINSGKMSLSIEILKEINHDDDQLIIKFSETPDPSISCFK